MSVLRRHSLLPLTLRTALMGAHSTESCCRASSARWCAEQARSGSDLRQALARGHRSMSLEIDTRTLAGLPAPPENMVCPVSRCLLTEPVTLLNTGVTLQRSSAQKWYRTGSKFCPVTGELISGWAILQSNEGLRELVVQWAAKQGVSAEDLNRVGNLMHRSASA